MVAVDALLTVPDATALRARVDELGKPLRAVLLTHGHPDHYNGVRVPVGEDEVPVYSTGRCRAGDRTRRRGQGGAVAPDVRRRIAGRAALPGPANERPVQYHHPAGIMLVRGDWLQRLGLESACQGQNRPRGWWKAPLSPAGHLNDIVSVNGALDRRDRSKRCARRTAIPRSFPSQIAPATAACPPQIPASTRPEQAPCMGFRSVPISPLPSFIYARGTGTRCGSNAGRLRRSPVASLPP